MKFSHDSVDWKADMGLRVLKPNNWEVVPTWKLKVTYFSAYLDGC